MGFFYHTNIRFVLLACSLCSMISMLLLCECIVVSSAYKSEKHLFRTRGPLGPGSLT